MTKENALIPVEQRDVEFYGDEITAVRLEDGRVYIPIKPVCDLLGVAWSPQRRRINRDHVLSEEAKGVTVTVTPGGRQEMFCLPLDYLSGWLFGINADRVNPEIKDRLIRYQRECYKVLAEAFSDGLLTAEPDFDTLLSQVDGDAVQAYHIARAIMKLAQNQIMLEAKLTGRLDTHEERLEAIEGQLSFPDHVVTQPQAVQISQAIKAVAIEYGKKTGKNEFGGVYGEMYRKFDVTSYKALPASKFDECIAWLTDWHQSLVSGNPF